MKKMMLGLALSGLLVQVAAAGVLTSDESARLRSGITAMLEAFERGDAEALMEATHPALHAYAGGRDAFERITREAVAQLHESGVRISSLEIGEPTATYRAGDEEICFVPKVSIMEGRGRRMKSTTFMIAIRRIGDTRWTYIEGAGLRKNPGMLHVLFPELARDVPLPPNRLDPL